MDTTNPATLGKARHITGPERDKIRAELRDGYLAGASIRDLAAQTGRSFGFVHRLLSEAGVILRGRGGDQTQRHSGQGLHNTDLFDWLALRRAHTGRISQVAHCYFDSGRKAPCYLTVAFDRLIHTGHLQRTEQHPGRTSIVLTPQGRVRFNELNHRAADQ